MTTSILTIPSYLQRPSYRELLRRFSVALGLAGRGNLRWGAASRSHGANITTVSWWLSGGISAANAIAAYQPIGAVNPAASYVNLANPGTYNAAPGVAPTWASATGWGGGTGKYLLTGIVPSSNWSWIIRISGFSVNGYVFGSINSSGGSTYQMTLRPNVATGVTYANSRPLFNVLPAATDGVFAAAGSTAYRNGIPETGSMTQNGTNPLEICAIGLNVNGSFSGYSGNVLALAIYDTTLTAPQVAAVSAAMANLTG